MSRRIWSRAARLTAWPTVGLCFLAACSGADPTHDRPAGQPTRASTESDESSHVDHTYSGAWLDVTDAALGPTAEWTNNVEAADIDTDGDIDLLFANSGTEKYWTPVENRVFLNRGDGTFTDATRQVVGKSVQTTRVIKVADVNADTAPDIIVGNVGSRS